MAIEERDDRAFMRDFHTPGTRAYDHALDISVMIWELMQEQGLSKTELARRMGISKSHLSNLLNTQPNMTLETIAKFELALGVEFKFSFVPAPCRGSRGGRPGIEARITAGMRGGCRYLLSTTGMGSSSTSSRQPS